MMSVSNTVKSLLIKLPGFIQFVSFLTRRNPRVFMYHRFCESSDKTYGKIDEETFDWQLRQIKGKWKMVTLGQYIELCNQGSEVPPYLVILTIDDGYNDFYRVAYPILKRHCLPATFFPTVHFIDGGWQWWDRINYALDYSFQDDLCIEIFGENKTFDLRNGNRQMAKKIINDYCLTLNEDAKLNFLHLLEKELNVMTPKSPPSEFAAATWEQLREMSNNNIEIGSHTMNHPILSRLPKILLEEEIQTSKERIEMKIQKTVLSFCYPNGGSDDINEIACQVLEKACYKGAVVAYEGSYNPFDPYRIPRIDVGTDKVEFHWKLCGMGSIVLRIKNGFGKLTKLGITGTL